MPCLGPNYNPNPPREWYRFENQCAYSNTPLNFRNGGAYQIEVLKKGNVLQYKKNSANLTKRQKYAQIARGMWTNNKITWATQSQTYTNPNIGSLKRVGYYNINAANNSPVINLTGRGANAVNNSPFFRYPEVFQPLTCGVEQKNKYQALPDMKLGYVFMNSGAPIVPKISNPPIDPTFKTIVLSPTIPSIGSGEDANIVSQQNIPKENIIPDGGTLICNISENICTGEVYKKTISTRNCNPTTDSDVPGPITSLCYDESLPTYYPRQRYKYSAGGNKWPEGEKFLFSANSIKPIDDPIINGLLALY
jgi:hypothetical protein